MADERRMRVIFEVNWWETCSVAAGDEERLYPVRFMHLYIYLFITRDDQSQFC